MSLSIQSYGVNYSLRIVSLFVLLSIITGCQTTSNTSSTLQPNLVKNGFALYILDCRWGVVATPYSAAEVSPVINSCFPDKVLSTIIDDHIQSYDWDSHNLRLTQEGSNLIKEQIGEDWIFKDYAFVVKLEGITLYSGFFYSAAGAAHLDFPVIHSESQHEQELFQILPSQFPSNIAPSHPIADDRLKLYFQETGKIL
jgi:hypothetical protein